MKSKYTDVYLYTCISVDYVHHINNIVYKNLYNKTRLQQGAAGFISLYS